MGVNKNWYEKWSVDYAARAFQHVSGLALKLEPEAIPLAWRFVLLREIPVGSVLNVSALYRHTHEALRLLQAQAWGGRFLPCAVLPHKSGETTAKRLAGHNDLRDNELTQRHVDALLEQWQQARSGS